MVIPKIINCEEIKENPRIFWDSVYDTTEDDDSDLTEIQLAAKRISDYDGEIQNGGHLQFLENTMRIYGEEEGFNEIQDITHALNFFDAYPQAKLLQNVLSLYSSRPRTRIQSIEEYVEVANEGEYDDFDNEYYDIRPSIEDIFDEYIIKDENEFVEIAGKDEEVSKIILIVNFIGRAGDIIVELIKNPYSLMELDKLLPYRNLNEIKYYLETMEKHKIINKMEQDERFMIELKVLPLINKYKEVYGIR